MSKSMTRHFDLGCLNQRLACENKSLLVSTLYSYIVILLNILHDNEITHL